MAEAKARLSELAALAEAGETVIIERSGRPSAELRVRLPQPHQSHLKTAFTIDADCEKLIAAAKFKHRFIGALAHLGPLTEEEATLFLTPDPEMERLVRSEEEDEFYQ